MKFRLCLLILLLLTSIFSGTVLAQEPELEELTTEDGFFTLGLPADWVVSTSDGLGLNIANTPETLASIEESFSIEELALAEGSLGVVSVILPAEVLEAFQEMMAEMPAGEGEDPNLFTLFGPDSDPKEMAVGFADLLAGQEDGTVAPVIGEPELIDLTDELEAGIVTVSGETFDGLVITFLKDGDAIAGIAVAPKGGIEGNEELLYAIFASVTVDDSYVESIMAGMGLE